jgi:ribosomal protein S18 acetylase RimI-like enzyme
MEIKEVNNLFFLDRGINKFAKIIYANFIYFKKYPNLQHNIKELDRLLTDNNMYGLLVYQEKKIIGYLIGEKKNLTDSRNIYYISYVYISPKYRNNGLASYLINNIKNKFKNKLDGLMLTTDKDNEKLYNFYLKKGFMDDITFRNYGKHEVLSLMF